MSIDTPLPTKFHFAVPIIEPPALPARGPRTMPHRLIPLAPTWQEATASLGGGGVLAYAATATSGLSINEKVAVATLAVGALVTGLGPPLKRAYESIKGTTREQRLKDREAERQADAADRDKAFQQFGEQVAALTNQMGTQFGEQLAALAAQMGAQIAALHEKLGIANAEAAAARAEAAASRAETSTARAEATEARQQLAEMLGEINRTAGHIDRNVTKLKGGDPETLKRIAGDAVDLALKNEKEIAAINARLSGDDIPVVPPPASGE